MRYTLWSGRMAAAIIATFMLLTGVDQVGAQTLPPAPPVGIVSDNFFGTTVPDPYRYMEDLKNADVAAWMKAQADYTRAVLDKIPQRGVLLDEVTKYGDAAAARVTSLAVVGDHIYYLKRNADENIPKLYMRARLGAAERLLVDPDKTPAPEGKHNAIDYFQASPDNRYLAYGISIGGSEESVLHIIDLETGKETGDVIDRANYASPSFLTGGRLLYSRLQKMAANAPVTDKYQNQRAYLHTLGTDPDKDTEVLGVGLSPRVAIDPAELVFVGNPIGSKYLVAGVVNGVQNEIRVYVAPLTSLAGGAIPWVKVAEAADAVTQVTTIGDTMYLLSHKDASRFKILRVDLAKPDIAAASVVIPAAEAVITGLSAAKDALYVQRMNGGAGDVLKIAYTSGAKPVAVPLPFTGNIDALATDPREPGVIFEMRGWTRFGGYYAYTPASNKTADTYIQPQGKYDAPANLAVDEVKVKAGDGTMVPMSIVYKKGIKRDGSNPTIVWGYGAYGISQTASFAPTLLPWYERGGIFAVAHVRGGGEYGEDWHKAGYKLTKANTWNDTIACAQWLIAHKYTSSPKMAVRGGSAGGILVGRSITERPDLFAAAIDDVPVSDTLRAETSANGIPNIPEFGTVKTEEGFKGLFAMSPYAHVKDGTKYPAVLLTTGINDPRVDAWEAAKMAARLQAASTSGKPILLRIDYDAGHGFGSTKKSTYEVAADRFAFLFWQFGVAGFQPK
jgi:prolyl oligopeptidase